MVDTPNPTPSQTPAPAWHAPYAGNADIMSHITNVGWDKLDAGAAAAAAAKAHFEAQRFVGVPTDQLLRLPKDPNDAAGWQGVYERLGKPKDTKEYDFSQVKFSDGGELDPAFVDFLRETAGKSNLSKAAATELAKSLAGWAEKSDQASATDAQAAIAAERTALQREWGANHNTNTVIARNAATKFGVDAETIQAMENVLGYSKVMNFFLKVGQATGEDTFVGGKGTGTSGAMTREQALARVQELKQDASWVQRYTNGDRDAVQLMKNLNRLISGDAESP